MAGAEKRVGVQRAVRVQMRVWQAEGRDTKDALAVLQTSPASAPARGVKERVSGNRRGFYEGESKKTLKGNTMADSSRSSL